MNRTPVQVLSVALLFAPGWLSAQTASAPKATESEKAAVAPKVVESVEKKPADAAVELERVEVTGSRMRTLGAEATALPVFALPQIELERRGVSRLADIRWAIPQLGAAVGFNDNLQNSGTSRAQTVGTSFNLRGLGGNSTLVLINGRRIPHTGQEAPGGAGGREDFSVDGIPVSAIERIEILPEGAGAIYGSEAIAGVVNVILKKNYTGAELRISYDNTFKSDVGQTTIALTAGAQAGKFSAMLTASYEKQNALASRDRWFTATSDPRAFGAAASAFFLSQPASGPGSFASSGSPQNTGQPNLPGLTTNIVGIPVGSNGSTTANSAFTTAVSPPYDQNQYTTSIDAALRKSVTVSTEYELTNWAKIYLDGRASEFRNEYTTAPLSLSISLPAGYPGNPFNGPAFLRKVFYDLPGASTISRQENQSLSVGVRGDILTTWRYDAGYSWARNIVSDDALSGTFNFTLLNAAIASANKPLLAYDSFNSRDPNPAGVLAGLMPFADHKDTTDYDQYSINADGVLWSGWAGDINLGVGLEAGKEKVKFWREASVVTPTFVLTKPFSRDTTAAFAEMRVPLLGEKQHLPFVHLLEIGGAVRAQDYSDVGGVTSPTYRAMFKPVSWVTLRTSRSEGFKPVRLYDLLGPVTSGTTTLTATSNLRDPLRGGELILGTYTRSFGGNPTLQPENSVSKNGGVVIDVPGKWFKGLSFSADYYQFDYTDRSGGPSNQVLFDFFPERITRGPKLATDPANYAGPVITWDATNINLAGVKTKGWDFRASYQRTFGFGDLSMHAALSDPNLTVTKATPAAAPSSTFGHQPKRMSGSFFWGKDAWDLGLSVNYQDRYYINGLTSTSYPSYLEFNPQVSYDFRKGARFSGEGNRSWTRWLAGSKASITIINALNRDPEMIDAANGRIIMDPRLRRYILTFSKAL
ncbi:MAG: TonB-dependent receptor plug domain-containing protein [Opitutaceae bacterium]|nr:TonB-dependent receptor plug domain-containing protein [Opitutaceae bacterium]